MTIRVDLVPVQSGRVPSELLALGVWAMFCLASSALFSYVGVHLMEPGPRRTRAFLEGIALGTVMMLIMIPLLVMLWNQSLWGIFFGVTLGIAAAMVPGMRAASRSK